MLGFLVFDAGNQLVVLPEHFKFIVFHSDVCFAYTEQSNLIGQVSPCYTIGANREISGGLKVVEIEITHINHVVFGFCIQWLHQVAFNEHGKVVG